MSYITYNIGDVSLTTGSSSYKKILITTINASKDNSYSKSILYKVYCIIDYFKIKITLEDNIGTIYKTYNELNDKVFGDIIKTIVEMQSNILKEKDDKK